MRRDETSTATYSIWHSKERVTWMYTDPQYSQHCTRVQMDAVRPWRLEMVALGIRRQFLGIKTFPQGRPCAYRKIGDQIRPRATLVRAIRSAIIPSTSTAALCKVYDIISVMQWLPISARFSSAGATSRLRELSVADETRGRNGWHSTVL